MFNIIEIMMMAFAIIFSTVWSTSIFIFTHSTQTLLGLLCVYGAYWCIRKVFVIEIAMHPAAKKTFKDMVRAFQAETQFGEEVESVCVLGPVDADLYPDTVVPTQRCVRGSKRVSYAVRVAHVAKAEVGLLSNCRANELIYARLCRKAMIEHRVRPSHIAHLVPLAVAACFIPLDADFLAASLRQGKQMKKRVALLGKPVEK